MNTGRYHRLRLLQARTCQALVCIVLAGVFLAPAVLAGYTHSINLPPFMKYRFGNDPSWALLETFDGDWERMGLPNEKMSDVPPGYAGSVWYRLCFIVPRDEMPFPQVLWLGEVVGDLEAYLNGTKLEVSHQAKAPVNIKLPPDLLRPGEDNLIALHVSGAGPGAGSIRATGSNFSEHGLRIEAHEMRLKRIVTALPTDPNTGIGGVQIAFAGDNAAWKGAVRVLDYYGRQVGAPKDVELPGADAVSFEFPVESENWHRVEFADAATGEKNYGYFRCPADAGDRPALNLSGEWDALPVMADRFTVPPADDASWEKTYVPLWYKPSTSAKGHPYEIIGAPGSSRMLNQPFQAAFRPIPGHEKGAHRAWFRKRFDVPAPWKDKAVELVIGANQGRAVVYVNNMRVGEMTDPFEPLRVDVTPHVRFGDANELLMAVQDRTSYLRPDNPVGPNGKPVILSGLKGSFVGMAGYNTGSYCDGVQVGGPWQEVFLRARPKVSVYDVVTVPEVSAGRLKIETAVTNHTDAPVTVRLHQKIFRKDEMAADLGTTDAVTIHPGGEKQITVEKSVQLENWDFDNPVLHRLETTLLSDDKSVDVQSIRFGYREITTDGTDFVLNGKPVHFFRKDVGVNYYPSLFAPSGLEHHVRYVYKPSGSNLGRTSVAPPEPFQVEVCDEVGHGLSVEGCWSAWQATDLPEFWENARHHWQAIVKRFRNNPSVLLYAFGNETSDVPYEQRELPESVFRVAKSIDPTRLYGWDDDTDYTREFTDYICVHYPYSVGSHNLWPDSAYWWQTPMPVRFNRHPGVFDWKRDKPVVIGEMNGESYDWPPDGLSEIVGPLAYWEGDAGSKGWLPGQWESTLMLSRGARISGVSATDYCQINHARLVTLMEPVCAALREWDHSFYSGETVDRTFTVFNGLRHDDTFSLEWKLLAPEGVVDSGEVKLPIKAGGRADTVLKLTLPQTDARRKLAFAWKLRGPDELLYQDDRTIDLFPARAPIILPESLSAALYDPLGRTAQALERVGLSLPLIDRLDGKSLADKDLVIVGEDALSTDGKENAALLNFAQAGGRVAVLRQNLYVPPAPLEIEQDNAYEINTAFIADSGHPLMAGIEKDDFRYWCARPQHYPPHEGKAPRAAAEPTYPPNHRVSTNALRKPVAGNYRIILESGGTDGLCWTPLIEFPVGKGAVLLCQLLLDECVGKEPVADRVLANLFDWAAAFAPAAARKLVVWAPGSPRLVDALRGAGVAFTQARDFPDLASLRAQDVLLLDGSADPPNERIPALKTWIERGGSLWAHALKPTSAAADNKTDKPGLVGWWPLDETGWKDAVAADASGHGNVLKPEGPDGGPSSISWAQGRGAHFENGQYFVGDPASKDFKVGKQDFSLEAWINPADLKARSGIVGVGVSDYSTSNYGFYQRSGEYQFLVNGQRLINGTTPNWLRAPIQGGWHHLIGVRSKDGLFLYIDGKLAASGGTGDVDPDEDGDLFLIGAGDSNNQMRIGAFFTGDVDEVKLYKGVALTADQIAAQYAGSLEARKGGLGAWSELLPEGLDLEPMAKSEAVVVRPRGLAAGLSNADLWLRLSHGYGVGGMEGKTLALTNLMWNAVTGLDRVQGADSFLEPAALVQCRIGKGSIAIDQLLWEDVYQRDERRAKRIVATLATNMGVPVRSERAARLWRYAPVGPIEPYANRNLSKAGDILKRPPLLGEGDNDLRDLPVGQGDFAGIPLRVYPYCVLLAGSADDPLPAQSDRIPIGRWADRIAFLHAALGPGTGQVGQYVIYYENQKTQRVPIVMDANIADWYASPKNLPSAKIAWTGKNPVHDPVSLYVTEVDALYPSTPILSVWMESYVAGPKLVLIALSTGRKVEGRDGLSYKTYRPLDLSAVVNAGLTTDQEPKWPDVDKNDLREFLTGEVTLADIPARIPPGPKSCLAMWSTGTTECPKEVTVDVDAKTDAIFFLHTSIYGAASWVYCLHYADGSTADVPVNGGVDVWDWHKSGGEIPKLSPAVRVAWQGLNHYIEKDVTVYWHEWKNPRPDAAIKSIHILHDKQERAVPIILGITIAATQ
ncbi:MAG: LamG-like jellyroll fold domain-containing protein [Planctomycetota bacterium]